MNGRRAREAATAHSDSPTRRGRTTVLLAACAIALSIHLLMAAESEGESAGASAPEPPALWSEPVTSCGATSKRAALELARSRASLARAQRARRPFSVASGVAAVPLYEEAAACFRVAGESRSAVEHAAIAVALRSDMAEDFRTHRVRLEHALSVEDWKTVRLQVRALRAFVRNRPGEYASWLSSLERRAGLIHGSEEQ